jgi:integrase
MLRDGRDIRALAEYLGHSDAAFTLRVYRHLMRGSPDRMRRADDRAFDEDED